MLNNILNIEGASVLSRDQQKSINGGNIQPPCAVYLNGTTTPDYEVEDAVAFYDRHNDGENDVRYCCASCFERQWYLDYFHIH